MPAEGTIEYSLLERAARARVRVLRIEGDERAIDGEEASWQRVRCHVDREDASWAAIPLLFAIAALSFEDARPRALSRADYAEMDEWLMPDMLERLTLTEKGLRLDADYVRGRMMKTTITISAQGSLVIKTRNRYHLAPRWMNTLKGRRHLELLEGVLDTSRR